VPGEFPVQPPNLPSVDGPKQIATYRRLREVPAGDVDVAVLARRDPDSALRPPRQARRIRVVFRRAFAEFVVRTERAGRPSWPRCLTGPGGTHFWEPEYNRTRCRVLPGTTAWAGRSRLVPPIAPPGRPLFQGQELVIRFSHWGADRNEADLESRLTSSGTFSSRTSGARCDRGVPEGFNTGFVPCGRPAHAARRGVPLVTGEGRALPRSAVPGRPSHTGHPRRKGPALTSVSASFGSTRRDPGRRLDELLDTAAPCFAPRRAAADSNGLLCCPSPAAQRAQCGPAPAAGRALPPRRADTATLRQGIPDYLRMSTTRSTNAPPVGDWRGRRSSSSSCRSRHGMLVLRSPARSLDGATGSSPTWLTSRPNDPTTDCVVLGLPIGYRGLVRVGLSARKLPVFRTFGTASPRGEGVPRPPRVRQPACRTCSTAGAVPAPPVGSAARSPSY